MIPVDILFFIVHRNGQSLQIKIQIYRNPNSLIFICEHPLYTKNIKFSNFHSFYRTLWDLHDILLLDGWILLCQGLRIDSSPTSMGEDMQSGLMVYTENELEKLYENTGKSAGRSIFEPANLNELGDIFNITSEDVFSHYYEKIDVSEQERLKVIKMRCDDYNNKPTFNHLKDSFYDSFIEKYLLFSPLCIDIERTSFSIEQSNLINTPILRVAFIQLMAEKKRKLDWEFIIDSISNITDVVTKYIVIKILNEVYKIENPNELQVLKIYQILNSFYKNEILDCLTTIKNDRGEQMYLKHLNSTINTLNLFQLN